MLSEGTRPLVLAAINLGTCYQYTQVSLHGRSVQTRSGYFALINEGKRDDNDKRQHIRISLQKLE